MPAAAQQVAQAQTAQVAPETVPEQVLVTGSLIHGAAAVGVPVTTLGMEDFKQTGATTTADLFKTIPFAMVPSFESSTDAGSRIERGQTVNFRGLNSKGPRTLMLIDGMRFPGQGDSGCSIDPSIIPQLAIDRVDILADGASATYGSDAVAGVLNLILRRGYEGAITEGSFATSPGYGHNLYRGSALYGTKWASGDLTATYEYYIEDHVDGTKRPYYTMDFFAAQGLDDRIPLANSRPGTVSSGAMALPVSNPNNGVYPVSNVPGSPGNFSATQGTSCANCFAIPKGQNGVGLTWAQILAHPGTGNEVNPFVDAWEQPDQYRSAAVVTFDQNIVPGVQLFADGFYDNRRSIILSVVGPNSPDPGPNNAFISAVPTINPYYPIGAPNNLRVAYDIGLESPVHTAGNELGDRYDGGFNLELPFNWTGKVYGAVTSDRELAMTTGIVNTTQASAALGWTIPASAVLASYAKPSNVPYLNLFCDANAFTCNSPATLSYITGFRRAFEEMIIHEYGGTADGTIVSLPGGDLKAAVGGTYTHFAYVDDFAGNYVTSGTAQINEAIEYRKRQVFAGFAQVNVPIIGDANKLPFVERAQIEASIRYDHYSDFGGTTNPKISGDWLVTDGLKFTGAWGTSFRAPTFQEAGSVSGALDQALNQAASNGSNNYATCPQVGQAAVPGSVAAIIDPNCTAALQFLGGIRLGNGAGIASAVRPAGFVLGPEKAQNLSAGFDFSPDDRFLKGLDLQATYYFVLIRSKLQGCSVGTTSHLDDPNYTSCYVIANNNPNFQQQVISLLTNPRSTVAGGLSVASNIAFIADGAIKNIGWESTNGVDFAASYDFAAGDLGAWNAGVTGNYVLDDKTNNGNGAPTIDTYSTPQNGTANSGGRLRYRARLGWAGGPDGAFSVTGFMNFIPSFNANGSALPPLCFLQGNPACASFGPQFAQYTQQYAALTNYVPSGYTFDLSLGYRTGDTPANRYLKNIGVQLTVTDLLDKKPPFQYSVATNSNTVHAFYNGYTADQRRFTLVLTKVW